MTKFVFIIFVIFLSCNANAELSPEPIPNVAVLPSDYPDNWIFAHDVNFASLLTGQVVVLDIAADTKEYKSFEDKPSSLKSVMGDQIIFDYDATVDGKEFEGSKGKGVTIELGKDLFLKGFDQQLVGVKKGETKIVNAVLPENHPKKELANKKTIFKCSIKNIKESKDNKIDDDFAKMMGAKNMEVLTTIPASTSSNMITLTMSELENFDSMVALTKLDECDITTTEFSSLATKDAKIDQKP